MYVRRHTSIPVPTIIASHIEENSKHSSSNYIVMKRIAVEQLVDAWPTMSAEAKSNTLRHLKSYLNELHNLRPDGAGWIGSCSGGSAYDHRLDNRATCGPFASVIESNDYLVEPVKRCPRPDFVVKFSGENILIDKETGNVNAIIDWEMAGFWPVWWEYRKALSGARPQVWWYDILNKIMDEYPDETEAEMDIEMF